MYDFKDPARLTRIAVACVAVYMVVDVLFGLSLINVYVSGQDYLYPDELGFSAFAGVADVVMSLLCFVVVGRWIYRASANAHTFSDEMTISPGWAVGWYFVPFMNLVRPYQAMREIWLASHFRGNWHGEPAPGMLGWWWGLWIVTSILGNLSFRLSMTDVAAADTVFVVDLAGAFLHVPLCLILIRIMRAIACAQGTATHDEIFA